MISCYVAGPMRNHPFCNFPAFDFARDLLLAKGYKVFSPADHDRDLGYDFTDPNCSLEGFPMKDAILWDLHTIADCDAVYMLKGWENSIGATLEHQLAKFLSKTIMYEEHLLCHA